MSDTPRTDKACGWPVGHHGRIDSSDLKLSPDGPFVHSSVARELERENAALREWVKAEGERMNVCTYDLLNEICEGCQCVMRKGKKP